MELVSVLAWTEYRRSRSQLRSQQVLFTSVDDRLHTLA